MPYAFGLIALAWAVVDRRRIVALASGGELRQRLLAQVRRIDGASKLPRQEAATTIAEALRVVLPYADSVQRDTVDRLIGQLEALIFAPAGSSDTALDVQIHRDAVRIARQIAASATPPRESA